MKRNETNQIVQPSTDHCLEHDIVGSHGNQRKERSANVKCVDLRKEFVLKRLTTSQGVFFLSVLDSKTNLNKRSERNRLSFEAK